jgi:hypothetical protein
MGIASTGKAPAMKDRTITVPAIAEFALLL